MGKCEDTFQAKGPAGAKAQRQAVLSVARKWGVGGRREERVAQGQGQGAGQIQMLCSEPAAGS